MKSLFSSHYRLVCLSILSLLLHTKVSYSQNSVGIGTETPNPNAILHLQSTGNNQGLLIPSVTSEQRLSTDFINKLDTADNGLLVFDLTEKTFYYWQDTQWINLNPQSNLLAGNGINISGSTIENIGDLDSLNELQELVLVEDSTSREISIEGANTINFSIADNDNDSTNELQGLESVLLNGNSAANNTITNLGDPVNDTDAVNKLYVDNSSFSGSYNDLSDIPADIADGDDIGLETVVSDATLTGGGTGPSPLSIADGGISDIKISNVAPTKLTDGGATTGQALVWNGSNWAPQSVSGSAFNTANILPKGNGSTQVGSRIFDDGTYMGFGRTSRIDATSLYDFDLSITGSGFGGFSLNSTSATGNPYLAFWLNGTLGSYIYQSGTASLRFYVGGNRMSILPNGNIGVATTNPSARLDVVGSTELNGQFITPASGTTNVVGALNLSVPNRRIIRINGAAGTSPTISGISAGLDGQEVIIMNVGNVGVFVSGDVEPLPANAVVLDNLGVTLGKYSTLHLIFDEGLGAWIEVSRSINEFILN